MQPRSAPGVTPKLLHSQGAPNHDSANAKDAAAAGRDAAVRVNLLHQLQKKAADAAVAEAKAAKAKAEAAAAKARAKATAKATAKAKAKAKAESKAKAGAKAAAKALASGR